MRVPHEVERGIIAEVTERVAERFGRRVTDRVMARAAADAGRVDGYAGVVDYEKALSSFLVARLGRCRKRLRQKPGKEWAG